MSKRSAARSPVSILVTVVVMSLAASLAIICAMGLSPVAVMVTWLSSAMPAAAICCVSAA